MYKVTKVSDNTSTVRNEIKIIKEQENGAVVLIKELEEAQGIIAPDNETIYAIQGRGWDDKYEVVTIEEITTEDYLIQISNQLNETTENQLTIMSALADLYEQSEVV